MKSYQYYRNLPTHLLPMKMRTTLSGFTSLIKRSGFIITLGLAAMSSLSQASIIEIDFIQDADGTGLTVEMLGDNPSWYSDGSTADYGDGAYLQNDQVWIGTLDGSAYWDYHAYTFISGTVPWTSVASTDITSWSGLGRIIQISSSQLWLYSGSGSANAVDAIDSSMRLDNTTLADVNLTADTSGTFSFMDGTTNVLQVDWSASVVPEPASALMLLVGGAVIAFKRRYVPSI